MIKLNEANILIIENNGMTLDIEDDIPDGISMNLYVPSAHISMTGLYEEKELQPFLTRDTNDFHFFLKNSIATKKRGTKKIRETVFSTKNVTDETENDYKIIFISEDTRIQFPLDENDWKELVHYLQYMANGRKSFQI